MASTGIDIRIDHAEATSFFTRLGRELRPEVLTKMLGQRYLEWIGDSFRQEGAERPWPPLAQSTIDARRKGRGAGRPQILRDTRKMEQSITPGAAGNVFRAGALSVTVGTRVPYAIYHDSDEPRRHLPQRKILPTSRLAEIIAQATIQKAIDIATERMA